jgi:hypothetical protein
MILRHCVKEFEKIYLSWRQGQGCRRHIIGVLDKDQSGKPSFQYIRENVEDAKKEGFSTYTEFPQIDRTYNGNVLDIFGQRLIKAERSDVQSFYDFWEIDPQHKDDKYYLLAHTQGLSTADNFEFLADYNPVDGLHFLTELAGLSQRQLPLGSLNKGDSLQYLLEPLNERDSFAVKVLKAGEEIGYIKKVHCRVFHKPGSESLKLNIKALDQNGFIKRVFVKVHKE